MADNYKPPNPSYCFGRIPPDLHQRFINYCNRQGRMKGKQLAIILTDYLDRHDIPSRQKPKFSVGSQDDTESVD